MDHLGPTPPPFEDRSHEIVVLSCVLHSISIPVLSIRIWSRSHPVLRLGWDDWAIMAAAVLDLAQWILILVAIGNGLGRPSFYVPSDQIPIGRACLYFANHCSGWVIGFAKLSIAYSLFRLRRDSTIWRVFLLAMMTLPVAIAVTTSSFLLASCHPLSAVWDSTVPDAVCLPREVMSTGILVTASLTVVTDFILALLPITFIRRIRRSVLERVILGIMMGLGLVASAASICKIVNVSSNHLTGDSLRDGVDVTFWGILEVQLGIIAASVPFIRRTVERWLVRMGLIPTRLGPTFYHMDNTGSAATRGTGGREDIRPHLDRDLRGPDNPFDTDPD